MDINFICTRKRKEFGKPCAFVDIGPVMLCEIDPDPAKKNEYIKLSKVDREIDNSVKMCAHEINTLIFPVENRGMNHREGGWPASVDNEDEESMTRFRKKIEKDKNYVNSVKALSQFTEHFIMENTSIDIYEEYFENEKIKRDTKWSLSVKNTFQDLNAPYRSVVDMSWDNNSTKFAAVYSAKNGKSPTMPCLNSYVWDIENNITPLCVLEPVLPMTVVEFSPFNSNLILGGYMSGQIALWDIRYGSHYEQLVSLVHNSHKNLVTGIKWLLSRQDTAFFSGARDGTLRSWDCRNLSAPTEIIHLDHEKDDIPNLNKTYAIACLEYDPTLPYKFMVGTENGCVLSFNRKYKEDEEKLSLIYDCQSGPILNVERNAFFPNLFLSCDAWSLKLWSENIEESPVLNIISHDGYYTDSAWSSTRTSTTYATKTTGFLEIWDFPGKIKEPLLNIKLSDESLLSVAVPEKGNHVICGSLSGTIQLLNIPQHLQSNSETEIDFLRECIKESGEIFGGKPRSERISMEELGIDDEWWDPVEKAEDIRIDIALVEAMKLDTEEGIKTHVDEDITEDMKIHVAELIEEVIIVEDLKRYVSEDSEENMKTEVIEGIEIAEAMKPYIEEDTKTVVEEDPTRDINSDVREDIEIIEAMEPDIEEDVETDTIKDIKTVVTEDPEGDIAENAAEYTAEDTAEDTASDTAEDK